MELSVWIGVFAAACCCSSGSVYLDLAKLPAGHTSSLVLVQLYMFFKPNMWLSFLLEGGLFYTVLKYYVEGNVTLIFSFLL